MKKTIILILCLMLSGCMVKQRRMTDTTTEISIPNPVCDIIDSFNGKPQVTQPVQFYSSQTPQNMGPWR